MSSWSVVGTTDWENCAILWGDRNGHLVSIQPICEIFSVSRVGKVNSLYTIFEGN